MMANMGDVDAHKRKKFLRAVQHDTVEDVILHCSQTGKIDTLLHAIDLECISVLRELLQAPQFLSCIGETSKSGYFPPDVTPLMLAAHHNNYQMITLLLKHGARLIDRPVHDHNDPMSAHTALNVFRAIAAPMYLLTANPTNPIHASLSLSHELDQWSMWEYEFFHDYHSLACSMEEFAVELLKLTHPEELDTLLVRGPNGRYLETLQYSVDLERKNFVASANFQLVLSPIWYGRSVSLVNKLRKVNLLFRACLLPLIIVAALIELPLFSIFYITVPNLSLRAFKVKDIVTIPLVKFINHMASQFTFLMLLIRAAATSGQRAFERDSAGPAVGGGSAEVGGGELVEYKLLMPSLTEWLICMWVIGMVWNELKQVQQGVGQYFDDLWNRLDATMIILYFLTVAFRFSSHVVQEWEESSNNMTSTATSGVTSDVRDWMRSGVNSTDWHYSDLVFLSEGVFAVANIFSFMRLVTLATLSQQIGPMQISLSRMVKDVVKFMFIFCLVLLSFACGLHQLNWFFKTECLDRGGNGGLPGECADKSDKKAFDSLFRAMRTLFWALFNLSPPPNNIEPSIDPRSRSTPVIMGIVESMYASYYVAAVIVLLRMLVAMMTTSYRDIESKADVEWKYARSRLWLTYIESGSTLPPPLNLLPSVKWAVRGLRAVFTGKVCKYNTYWKPEEADEESNRQAQVTYQRLVGKLFERYMMEKARENMYAPQESEEMSFSINKLYVENRRLVNLIQRLTRDSEEHAKSWFADYNIRGDHGFDSSHDNYIQLDAIHSQDTAVAAAAAFGTRRANHGTTDEHEKSRKESHFSEEWDTMNGVACNGGAPDIDRYRVRSECGVLADIEQYRRYLINLEQHLTRKEGNSRCELGDTSSCGSPVRQKYCPSDSSDEDIAPETRKGGEKKHKKSCNSKTSHETDV